MTTTRLLPRRPAPNRRHTILPPKFARLFSQIRDYTFVLRGYYFVEFFFISLSHFQVIVVQCLEGGCNDPKPFVPYFRLSLRIIGHVPTDDLCYLSLILFICTVPKSHDIYVHIVIRS